MAESEYTFTTSTMKDPAGDTIDSLADKLQAERKNTKRLRGQLKETKAELAHLRSRITVGDIVTYQGSTYEVEAIKRFPKDIGIRVRLVIGQDAPRELMFYDGWVAIEDVELVRARD